MTEKKQKTSKDHYGDNLTERLEAPRKTPEDRTAATHFVYKADGALPRTSQLELFAASLLALVCSNCNL
jgi:hypothetical protein